MPAARTDDALRDRAKMVPLEPPAAWDRVAALCAPLPTEDVPIGEAAGRVLAAAVVSEVDLPRETNSAMDGFAVRAAEGPHEGAPIAGESRAGEPFPGTVPPRAVIRIATGATLPPELDAVVRVEDSTADATGTRVSLTAARVGANIRHAGADLQRGGEIVAGGVRLAPHHLTVLAAAGRATVPCFRRPRVSLVVTGDEIVPPGAPVAPGQVTDVHGIALPALVRAAGGEVGEVVHAPDGRTELVERLEALTPCDVVLVTGGVSVGPHDHTRPAFNQLGIELVVERLLLRPGQPTAIGHRPGTGQLWFGLPGNPVSAFAISALFLVPALRVLSGAPGEPFTRHARQLTTAARPDAARWLALRAIRHGDTVEVLQGQDSHQVAALARANSLVLLPPGTEEHAAGATVDVIDLDEAISPGPRA